jgi:hypothetical protein
LHFAQFIAFIVQVSGFRHAVSIGNSSDTTIMKRSAFLTAAVAHEFIDALDEVDQTDHSGANILASTRLATQGCLFRRQKRDRSLCP